MQKEYLTKLLQQTRRDEAKLALRKLLLEAETEAFNKEGRRQEERS